MDKSENQSLYEWILDIQESQKVTGNGNGQSIATTATPLQSDLSLCNNLDNFVAHAEASALQGRYNDPVNINSLNSDFTKANLVIRFHSDLLNEDFFLVSNPELRSKIEIQNLGLVVYLPQEIEHLSGLKPEEVKKLHYMRKAFGGQFISRVKAEDSIFDRQPKEKPKSKINT